ncbi:MAG: ComF family protein [Ilumatobacteraceae bacterium]
MVFSSSCSSCRQPGPEWCHACRFSLASAPVVHLPHGVKAALPYDGAARSAVLALKYRNRRRVARYLGALMVQRLGLREARRFDLVTWAPTSGRRAGQRGFDQAELLARHIARELGVPCRRLLYRTHGTAQTGLTRSERLDGPDFRARRQRRSLRVLVVDDVVTTGATLLASAEALAAAGVTEVVLIAAAATPEHGRPGRRALPPSDATGRLAHA